MSGVAGELSISSDASCGDTGCDIVVVNGRQLVLTVAAARMSFSVELSQAPSGMAVPLNAQPGGVSAPASVSVVTATGRCSNDGGTTVRGSPAPESGTVRVTYAGMGLGETIGLEIEGSLSCDEGRTWQPFGLSLQLLVTDVGG